MIVFEANYAKKLGLPGYSSHQYSVTMRTELADIHQVNEQSQQIHALLQRLSPPYSRAPNPGITI